MENGKEKIVAGALRECESKEAIEDVFNRFVIDDRGNRIDRLNDCMGNPQTFFTSGEISLDDKCELTVQMFLTGSWKLAEYYDRLNIGV